MDRAIGHERDRRFSRQSPGSGRIQSTMVHNFFTTSSFLFAMGADTVDFAQHSLLGDEQQSARVTVNIQPVANIPALTIDRDWLSFNRMWGSAFSENW
jgi:hypothetical protein